MIPSCRRTRERQRERERDGGFERTLALFSESSLPLSLLLSAFSTTKPPSTHQALELASVVVDGLKARPLPANLRLEERVVDLMGQGQGRLAEQDESQDGRGREEEEGVATRTAASVAPTPEYRRSLVCPNPEETNSAVVVTFQVCGLARRLV